jgi:hypothetical protein
LQAVCFCRWAYFSFTLTEGGHFYFQGCVIQVLAVGMRSIFFPFPPP